MAISPLGNSLTFSAGMQLPPVIPLREVVSEYSTSWPNSKWLVLPMKLLKWKNTSWSCSSVSMKPKLSYDRDHINFRMGFEIVNELTFKTAMNPWCILNFSSYCLLTPLIDPFK